MKRLRILPATMITAYGAIPLFSQERPQPTAKGIQDNSFLIEESYNQELGIKKKETIGNFA